jgi:hypothetical protein
MNNVQPVELGNQSTHAIDALTNILGMINKPKEGKPLPPPTTRWASLYVTPKVR